MRLFSYVVTNDSGFAPNPFYDACTLATDKPEIRKQAREGDWIIGTTGSAHKIRPRIIFAMQVSEACSFERYWDDDRFQDKKPNLIGSNIERVGDNIYRRGARGQWKQSPSLHSLYDGCPNLAHLRRDTSVNRVLVANRYAYWGAQGTSVPDHIRFRRKYAIRFDLFKNGPGYKSRFPRAMIDNFVAWFEDNGESGCLGNPKDWVNLASIRQIIAPGQHHHHH